MRTFGEFPSNECHRTGDAAARGVVQPDLLRNFEVVMSSEMEPKHVRVVVGHRRDRLVQRRSLLALHERFLHRADGLVDVRVEILDPSVPTRVRQRDPENLV